MKAKPIEPKQRWVPLADPVEIAALKLAGKWKPGIPLWGERNGIIWAESVELKTWREGRTGKRL